MNIFDNIYREKLWGDGNQVPLSGQGSTAKNSEVVTEWLDSMLGLGLNSIVDLGCGDLNYMSQWLDYQYSKNGDVVYTGFDISEEILNHSMRKTNGRWPLFKADVTTPGIRFYTDIVIVKDMIFHLEDEKIMQLLHNLSQSDYKYLILNTDSGASFPREPMNSAHWSIVSLESPPFLEKLLQCGKVIERKTRPEHGQYLLLQK